jgi:hypothetical protein
MSFGIATIQHAFATVWHDVIVGQKAVDKAFAAVSKDAPQIEAITSLIPGYGAAAADLERIAFAAFGYITAAVDSAGAAAGANGVSVTLDADLVAEIQKIIAAFPVEIAAAKAAVGK